jgi:hypothetical protein
MENVIGHEVELQVEDSQGVSPALLPLLVTKSSVDLQLFTLVTL